MLWLLLLRYSPRYARLRQAGAVTLAGLGLAVLTAITHVVLGGGPLAAWVLSW